jgi:Bacteriophage probable baseplate hub protein
MGERTVADVQIKVNGLPLPPTARLAVTKVSVHHDLNMSSSFSVSLHVRGWGLQSRPLIDDGLFAIGVSIDISLGYIGGPMDLVIAGEIADIEAEFDIQEPPSITVSGYDFRARLRRNSAIETYTNMTDSQIAAQVIARNQLTPVVTATSLGYEHVTQNNAPDLVFLHQRAELNGYEVTIDGRNVRFGPALTPRVVPIAFGDRLLGFQTSISGEELYGTVEIFGVDLTQPQNQQEYKVAATAARFAGTLPVDQLSKRVRTITRGPRTRAQAQEQAKNLVSDLAAGSVTGSGRCRGFGGLRAGDILAVGGIGDRFNGRYRVAGVSHAFSPQEGFSTDFRVTGSPA